MAKDIIMATREELNRLHIIKKIMEGSITQVKAARMLSLSTKPSRKIIRHTSGQISQRDEA